MSAHPPPRVAVPDAGAPKDAVETPRASELPGTPDGFARLWTPHRMVYIGGESKPASAAPGDCPFCLAPARSDDESLIVSRGHHVFAVLNLYPYNPGHLLVCPYRHIADLTEASGDERGEMSDFVVRAMHVLRATSGPAGFNLGMNQGQVAGAGIAAHLHEHVVPRWEGDANFLPVIGQTKAIPQLLADTRERLATAWVAAESAREG